MEKNTSSNNFLDSLDAAISVSEETAAATPTVAGHSADEGARLGPIIAEQVAAATSDMRGVLDNIMQLLTSGQPTQGAMAQPCGLQAHLQAQAPRVPLHPISEDEEEEFEDFRSSYDHVTPNSSYLDPLENEGFPVADPILADFMQFTNREVVERGPIVSDGVANLFNRFFLVRNLTKENLETLEEISKNVLVPANADGLMVPRINEVLWKRVSDQETKNREIALGKMQKFLAKGMVPLAQLLDLLPLEGPASDQRALVALCLKMLLPVYTGVMNMRAESVRKSLPEHLRRLCGHEAQPSSSFLFGDDLDERLTVLHQQDKFGDNLKPKVTEKKYQQKRQHPYSKRGGRGGTKPYKRSPLENVYQRPPPKDNKKNFPAKKSHPKKK